MADPLAEPARTASFLLAWGGPAGWGHLVRSAALAAELGARGWKRILWARGDETGLPSELRGAFDEVVDLQQDALPGLPDPVARSGWLVVDHYGVDDAMLGRLKGVFRETPDGRGGRILVLDDEGHRRLDAADLVVNPRVGLDVSPYAGSVQALTGEAFALLRPGLRAPARITSPFPPGVDPVLVMMGGTDPRRLTAAVLEGLADVSPDRFAPVLICSRSGSDAAAIGRALTRFGSGVWIEGLGAADLAGWGGLCRYGLTAAGGALFEMALMRLPFVAIRVAANQEAMAEAVARRWRMPVVDGAGEVRAAVATAFASLASQVGEGQGLAATVAVDGLGAVRVADAMANPRPQRAFCS